MVNNSAPLPRQKRSSRQRPLLSAASPLLLQSKSHQLAEHLRHALAHGELDDPLPPSRVWSHQLGVSRRTLDATLHTLQHQGLIHITPRGATVVRRSPQQSRNPHGVPHIVRALTYTGYERHAFVETFSVMQERLHPRGIAVRWEICRPARLRELAERTPQTQELFLLASIPSTYQRLFAERGHSTIVLGEVAPGLPLPYVNVDQSGAVRHAVFHLLQRGTSELHFVHAQVDSVGIDTAVATFREACQSWEKSPVTAIIHPTKLDRTSLLAACRRLARAWKGRQGVIVLAPVPMAMVTTALLHHGVTLPHQSEVVALFHRLDTVSLYPPFIHYRSPTQRVIHHLTEAAVEYFQSAEVPALQKNLSADMKRVT